MALVDEGVGHGDGGHAAALGHGHDQVLEGEGARDVGGDHVQVQLERVDLQVFHADRGGDGLGDHVLGQLCAGCPWQIETEGGDQLGRRYDIGLPGLDPPGTARLAQGVELLFLGLAAGQKVSQLFRGDLAAQEQQAGTVFKGDLLQFGHAPPGLKYGLDEKTVQPRHGS